MAEKKKKVQLINKQRELLTPNKVRELSGINVSDQEAEDITVSINKLARILYQAANQKANVAPNKCESGDDSSANLL
jgi:hypothetical protein